MNNKNILFILIILLVYVNLYTPLTKNNIELKEKLINLQNLIEKDNFYIRHKNTILKDLNNSKVNINTFMKNHFFQVKDTQVFNILQKQIKNEIKENQVTQDYIKWGESYTSDNFKEFPISVRVYGGIENIGNFFNSLYTNQKIIIKNFIVRRTKDYYMFEVNILGLKRK